VSAGMENLLRYDKFWVIWGSCLDKPRTIKDIQRIWGYGGNALYQKGHLKPIWEEMIDKRFIKRVKRIKKRGVSGLTLEASLNWLPSHLENYAKKSDFVDRNHLVLEIVKSIKDDRSLIKFLEDNREAFFFIDRIKLLFGNKENLKNNYEMLIFAPILVTLNIYVWRTLQKRMGVDENVVFFLTSTFIFNMNPRLNFVDYFLEVSRDLREHEIPSSIFNQRRVFGFWDTYSKRIKKSLFL
jgi:hypothetical protein